MGRMIIKPAKWHTSRPFWTDEGADIVETAMIDPETDRAEYRETEGQSEGQSDGQSDGQEGSSMGRRAVRWAGGQFDGADEAKNNPDGAE